MAKILVLDKGGQQGSDAAGLMTLTPCAPCLFPCHCPCLYHAALHASQAGEFSFFDVRAGERRSSFLLFHRPFWHCSLGVAQMLKWERPDLLFVEKSSIFAIAKEETVHSRRLPPFLGPTCGQNYPALGQNYKALGFIYVLFGEKHKALG